MHLKSLLVLIPVILAQTATAARLLAFYEVRPVDRPPAIDGVFDDACWQGIDAASTYFKYWVPDPVPGQLETEFRMVYDDRGIYLAIANYEEEIEAIRTNVRTPDIPDLWKDDCAEIYFDPSASGVGFSAFVVNALGYTHDSRRVDAAVTLPDWDAYGWRVATKVGTDRWTIEAFFPWSDLGGRARVGDVWMFDHVRYGWATGKFKGVTWSPGGAYARADHFGYIAFVGDEALDAKRIGTILQELVPPPWQLPFGDGFMVCPRRSEFRRVGTTELLQKTLSQLSAWRKKTREAIDEKVPGMPAEEFATWENDYEKAPKEADDTLAAVAGINELQRLQKRLVDIYWNARVRRLLTQF